MKVLAVNNEKIRAQIENWTTENTAPDVIKFMMEGAGNWIVTYETLNNPKFKASLRQYVIDVAQEIDFIKNPFESPELTPDEETQLKVLRDIDLGKSIVFEYLVGNKNLDTKVADSIAQAQKFGGVKLLLESGAIEASMAVLSTIEPDLVFTQDRKDYFINKLQTYLDGTSSKP